MTIVVYMEYEANMKRRNVLLTRCEDVNFNCLRSKIMTMEYPYYSDIAKRPLLCGISFIADDDVLEGDIPLKFLPCQLPPKELNSGSFTLPCTIGSLNLYAMAGLGASINVMLKSMFEHLKLANLKETDMLVEMANMSRKAPLGIVENILNNERQSVGGNRMIFANFLKDNPYKYHHEYPCSTFLRKIKEDQNLNINTYFLDFPQPRKPRPRDYSYEEWLIIKLGHINFSKSVRNAVLNEWVPDSFDVEIDYGKMRDDPYSRRFDEYKKVFDKEIKQLENEYDLWIGKKSGSNIKILELAFEVCHILPAIPIPESHEGSIQALEQETRDLNVENMRKKDLRASYGITTPQELRCNQIKEEISHHHSYGVTASLQLCRKLSR
nr:hypothetical protein [Tanacetum cinerariifolium]